MVITAASLGVRLLVKLMVIELALKGDGVCHVEGMWIKVFFQV